MNTGKVNTVFLRLEGPLQSWGENSKFIMRRTLEAPSKSGVLGMICCAMGVRRLDARPVLGRLNGLQMGVRIDRPGTLWCDYHTVGAGFGMITAEGKLKTGAQGTLVTRRYYLCDASFLVALQGDDAELVAKVAERLKEPIWPVYLGRKCCTPGVPVVERRRRPESRELANPDYAVGLREALSNEPWQPRLTGDDGPPEGKVACLVEWRSSASQPHVPPDAEIWDDSPVSFDPPVHQPRVVIRDELTIGVDVKRAEKPAQYRTPEPPRPRADYGSKEYDAHRKKRMADDHHLCVFCKAPAKTVQHITYRNVGTEREGGDLRSLCRLCHDAVTMIEYGLGMGLDRINPEEARWRDKIIEKRDEIVKFRSLETRRRRLNPEEVE